MIAPQLIPMASHPMIVTARTIGYRLNRQSVKTINNIYVGFFDLNKWIDFFKYLVEWKTCIIILSFDL